MDTNDQEKSSLKSELPLVNAAANTGDVPETPAQKKAWITIGPVKAILLVFSFYAYRAWRNSDLESQQHNHYHNHGHYASTKDVCPQVDAIQPSQHAELWNNHGELLNTDGFALRAADWLGGAVRVPTPSFDKMGPVGEDPRWEVFGPFHDYLVEAFPKTHANLNITKVNTYGLIYEWKGSDEGLKPLLLAAHQDVVPVDERTLDEWEYPPFSGYFDGYRVWGRGSSDDKSGLIGIMSTVETLLERNFEPARTIVLAFGFDEETSGLHGAASIAPVLQDLYGRNGYAMLVDEGGGFSEKYGGVAAVPAVAEKGYIDVRVQVESPGGHSSIPPPHTSIGMLAALLVQYESNPYTPHFDRSTPVYQTIQCYAEHAPDMDKRTRRAIKKSRKSDTALEKVEKILFKDVALKSLVGTTQAIDLIQGGVKTNALPEQAWAVVNHRINTDSSVSEVTAHDTALLKSLASTYNLSYTAFGEAITSEADSASAYGTLTLTDAWGTNLEPAPITPFSGNNAAPYHLLSGTIKATYDAHRSLKEDTKKMDIFVAPGIMSGNTDTRYYWNLTEHIFRYNHHNAGNGALLQGVHTVNENMQLDAFLEQIRFFTTLILNVDESQEL